MEGSLPTGTVTFLFTDVEGSTKLLYELGPERYRDVLSEHRRVLRDAFRRHGGVEVDTQGDAFFVAFASAPGALAAAREAQEALEVPVRMGIHTGTPLSLPRITSVQTSIAPRGSPRPATAGRSSSRLRPPRSSPRNCGIWASTGSRI